MTKLQTFIGIFFVFFYLATTAQSYVDKPYLQDYAEKFESDNKINSTLLQVTNDRNDLIKILSSNGLLQPYDKKLVADLQYRTLTDMHIIAIDKYKKQFTYLTDKAVLSNAWAGKFYFEHQVKNPEYFKIAPNFLTLIIGAEEMALFQNKKRIWNKKLEPIKVKQIVFDEPNNRFLIETNISLYKLDIADKNFTKVYTSNHNLTAITSFKDKIIMGTNNGLLTLNGETFKEESLNQKLPYTDITVLKKIQNKLWVGTSKGAFKMNNQAKFDYYASKRWLVDDAVIDISDGPNNSVLILTKNGLSKINFEPMTLEKKAAYFQKIQRLRHIRYGFTSDLTLKTPGDVTSGYYHDTDNDGLWTSMYLAGELFRYAVTKSEDAKKNAYEAFEAMERLTGITGLKGFPARSYERDGYELGLGSNGFSEEWRKKFIKENGRIWRLTKDGNWRWKSNTSSDESCGHFFVYALFAELAPDKAWRERAIHQIKIEMDHIINNNWYLVDWNGKPTAWGRWNPKYVNSFPTNVGDRRLNSTLILAFLQTAYYFTKDEKYKKEAFKLIDTYGYDDNANRSASEIGFEEGENLSDKWNHSDDEMYFLTIPAFVNYSFSKEQKEKHLASSKSLWEEERSEKNPLWNYLFALSGGKNIDIESSAWWLREFPMDLIDWKVDNSHRKDLTKIEPNFRGQTYTEVLPLDEQPMHLHNGAYRNNGGSDGKREYAPYIYLLPYWAGRYVNAISKNNNN